MSGSGTGRRRPAAGATGGEEAGSAAPGAAGARPAWAMQASRSAQEVALQVGGRPGLFLAVDAVLLGGGLFFALLAGGEPRTIYAAAVLLPLLASGGLAMADVVALERRAGSLDMALALPASWRYFARRLAVVCAILIVQSWIVVVLLWAAESGSFPLLPALLHPAAVCVFLAAAALFWAVRLATSGAVLTAVLATAAAGGRWVGALPVPPRESTSPHPLFGDAGDLFAALAGYGLLVAVAAVLALYAQRRLARPERLL
jgi:hypothetical protein